MLGILELMIATSESIKKGRPKMLLLGQPQTALLNAESIILLIAYCYVYCL
jgi:hypothetical protein